MVFRGIDPATMTAIGQDQTCSTDCLLYTSDAADE